MKKRIISVSLIMVLLTGCAQEINQVQSAPEVTPANEEQTETVGMDTEEPVSKPDLEIIDDKESTAEEAGCFEVTLEAVPYDWQAVSDAILGKDAYTSEKKEKSKALICGNEKGTVSFYGDTSFYYSNGPHALYYQILYMSGNGILCMQDARLTSLFPEHELEVGGWEEAEKVCDDLIQTMGYEYTEKNIYALDTELDEERMASQILMDYATDTGEEWDGGAEKGAYLLVYQNTALVEGSRESVSPDMNSICYMVYSPIWGLCEVNAPENFQEAGRTPVEIITQENVEKQLYEVFFRNNVPVDKVEVLGYELVYSEDPKAYDENNETSRAVPCWKIRMRSREEAALWKDEEGVTIRGCGEEEFYLLLDARVNGSVDTFSQNVKM